VPPGSVTCTVSDESPGSILSITGATNVRASFFTLLSAVPPDEDLSEHATSRNAAAVKWAHFDLNLIRISSVATTRRYPSFEPVFI